MYKMNEITAKYITSNLSSVDERLNCKTKSSGSVPIKMFRVYFVPLALVLISLVECGASETIRNDGVRQPKFGFLTGTSNMISTLAQDLLSRSTSSSQVLSLNLTNLVILFVLKAIIYGASSFGFGHGNYGRSVEHFVNDNSVNEAQSNGLLSEEELLFILSYLQADSTQKYDCLHRIACEQPSKAKEYLLAGKMFLKGTELIGSVPDSSRYAKILTNLQEAVSLGLNNQNCSTRYQCSMKNR